MSSSGTFAACWSIDERRASSTGDPAGADSRGHDRGRLTAALCQPSIRLSHAGLLDPRGNRSCALWHRLLGWRCLSLGGYVAATVAGGRRVLAIENLKWAGLIAIVCALTV